MSKETKFILLRGSVVFDRQISFFDAFERTKGGKNQAFRSVIEKLEKAQLVRSSSKNVEYLLLYKWAIGPDLIYCQLAKKTIIAAYNLENNSIKQEQMDSYPPLDVFVDLRKQQFAVELNTVIMTEEIIEKVIYRLLKSLTKNFDLFVKAIQRTEEFWDLISDKDEIKEILFDLVAPNLLNATGAANDLVTEAREELNASCVQLSFINNNGQLKATISALDSFVKYSSATGAWHMKIKRKGESKYRTIKSTDYCKKRFIETEIIELVRKMNLEGNVDGKSYQTLIQKIEGLFDNEE